MQQCPWSPQLGSTIDRLERKRSIVLSPHRTPTWAQSYLLERYHRSLHLVLEVICESRGLSNLTPRNQDYLSLWVGKGSEVELRQALVYMWLTYANEREKRSKARSRSYKDQEVILKLLTFKHNTRPCSLPGLHRKETIMATHAVDSF